MLNFIFENENAILLKKRNPMNSKWLALSMPSENKLGMKLLRNSPLLTSSKKRKKRSRYQIFGNRSMNSNEKRSRVPSRLKVRCKNLLLRTFFNPYFHTIPSNRSPREFLAVTCYTRYSIPMDSIADPFCGNQNGRNTGAMAGLPS